MRIVTATAASLAVLLASASADAREVTLRVGTAVALATNEALSSKTHVKGAIVALVTTEDVQADGVVAIPRGTAATGQVIDARATGGLGTAGRLVVRPLYLRLGQRTVRLAGAASDKASVSVGGVAGMVFLTPIFSGRSAAIPAGTAMPAIVEKTVVLVTPEP